MRQTEFNLVLTQVRLLSPHASPTYPLQPSLTNLWWLTQNTRLRVALVGDGGALFKGRSFFGLLSVCFNVRTKRTFSAANCLNCHFFLFNVQAHGLEKEVLLCWTNRFNCVQRANKSWGRTKSGSAPVVWPWGRNFINTTGPVVWRQVVQSAVFASALNSFKI